MTFFTIIYLLQASEAFAQTPLEADEHHTKTPRIGGKNEPIGPFRDII